MATTATRNPGGNGRIFPPVSVNLYPQAEAGPNGLGRRIVALANRPMSIWGRLGGWGLDPLGRVGRVLHLHKLALAAELAGAAGRADFFWSEQHRSLAKLLGDASVWRQLDEFAVPGASQAGGGPSETIRDRLFHEVFADTDRALFNGCLQDGAIPGPASRAYVHADRLQRLFALRNAPGDRKRALLGPVLEKVLRGSAAARDWDRAARAANDLLTLSPDTVERQDELVLTLLSRAYGELPESSSEASAPFAARTLATRIGELEDVRARHPRNVEVFRALGSLYLTRAVQLANARDVAAALVDMEKAAVYDPHQAQLDALRDRLAEIMRGMQDQSEQIRAELASKQGMALSADGTQLLRQAEAGFGQRDRFRGSAEAAEIATRRHVALAHRVWRDVGLPGPGDDEVGPVALLGAFDEILRDPPAESPGVAARWSAVAERNPAVAGVDRERVCAYLRWRLFDEAPQRGAPEQQRSADDAPALESATAPSGNDGEPFGYWLFSRKNPYVKAQAAVAVVVVVVALAFQLVEGLRTATRDAAYAELVDSDTAGIHAAALRAAELFLTAPPLLLSDGRAPDVKDRYAKALARWFVELPGDLGPDERAQIARYRASLER